MQQIQPASTIKKETFDAMKPRKSLGDAFLDNIRKNQEASEFIPTTSNQVPRKSLGDAFLENVKKNSKLDESDQ